MTSAGRACVWAMLLGWAFVQCSMVGAADREEAADTAKPAPARRDAAEVVKEGDMSQWLQYYQRERGDAWSKTPPAQPSATPAPAVEASPATGRETQPPGATPR